MATWWAGARRLRRRTARSAPARALPTDRVRPGLVFALMHPLRHLVNATTIDEVDPESLQPEYKLCAVRVEPAVERVA